VVSVTDPYSRVLGFLDRSRESSARGYNWATPFLGDINTGTRLSRLGVSDETVKFGYGFCVTWAIE
jgi:hypothetical protein